MRWRIFAALGAVLFAAAVGGSALGSNARPASVPDPGGTALRPSDLPAFTSLAGAAGDHNSDSCPGRHGVIDRPAPFQRCDTTGYIVTTAISGPGRAQIDAFARSQGYPVDFRGMPLLPIQGPFVASHSGTFEVYDDVELFANEATAKRQFTQQAYPRTNQLVGYRELTSSLGDARLSYMGGFGPDPASSETQIVSIWRRGNAVATLSTLGASDMSLSEHARLAAIIDRRLQALQAH